MAALRFFEWFQFGALACGGLIALSRALFLRARGVPVISPDRQRTFRQMAADILALMCLTVWAYEIIAYALSFRVHLVPEVLRLTVLNSIAIKTVGALITSFAVSLYAIAIRRLGESWRIGIDRTAPGPLVTDGIYRWTRHPIYVSLDLMFVGAFLALGRLVFLMLAFVFVPLIHALMCREERFLSQIYHDTYRDYRRRVGRYWSRHGHAGES